MLEDKNLKIKKTKLSRCEEIFCREHSLLLANFGGPLYFRIEKLSLHLLITYTNFIVDMIIGLSLITTMTRKTTESLLTKDLNFKHHISHIFA